MTEVLKIKPTQFLLLKVANLCNLDCSYCYWFKDKSVYEHSKLISDQTLNSFFLKLQSHIERHSLSKFGVSIHGGEPLLAGKKKIIFILDKLTEISINTGCKITPYIQTNGLLIDSEWVDIFTHYNIRIGVSIDGTKEVHDYHRKDLAGKPTFERIISNLKLLNEKSLKYGVLSVCEPNSDPKEVCDFLIHDLAVRNFDILIPDANYDSISIPQISNYYKRLIKLWYEEYYALGVEIRIVKNIFRGILGKKSKMQSIGLGVIDTCMIKPDGEIEALDSLHSLGYNFTKGKLNINTHEIDDLWRDDTWNEVYNSSIKLHQKCQDCKFKNACGGGLIVSRWSSKKRFDNPSVYCDQLFEIFEYAHNYTLKKINEQRMQNSII